MYPRRLVFVLLAIGVLLVAAICAYGQIRYTDKAAFKTAQAKHSVDAYELYLKRHHHGAFRSEARKAVIDLKHNAYNKLAAEACAQEKKYDWLGASLSWNKAYGMLPLREAMSKVVFCLGRAASPVELSEVSVKGISRDSDGIVPGLNLGKHFFKARVVGRVSNYLDSPVGSVRIKLRFYSVKKSTLNLPSTDESRIDIEEEVVFTVLDDQTIPSGGATWFHEMVDISVYQSDPTLNLFDEDIAQETSIVGYSPK